MLPLAELRSRPLAQRAAAADDGGDGSAPPPKVSIFVLTHDHVEWIGPALDSALAQEPPFLFEILVADDFSTDGTREMVREYAARHPGRIRTFLPERNLGVAGSGCRRRGAVAASTWRSSRGRLLDRTGQARRQAACSTPTPAGQLLPPRDPLR